MDWMEWIALSDFIYITHILFTDGCLKRYNNLINGIHHSFFDNDKMVVSNRHQWVSPTDQQVEKRWGIHLTRRTFRNIKITIMYLLFKENDGAEGFQQSHPRPDIFCETHAGPVSCR